ncbi:short-chain dehydrogenase [Bosea sp. AAP35]|uniref:SDR family oxidoreductase n=1 Tax=Bosea sp. AAP35 TaxID=1523417 RepID=UPI0006BA03F1|nr:SDR family oxidoreductase [Bosea sp. AAP35]KPF66575.1 short-chain dehydrogenase [Bosea sp. AAP35]
MANPFDLAGRVVVVTGGLGQLGRQFARALIGQGARVAVIDVARDDKRIAALSEGIDTERLMVLSGDITSRASLEQALASIEARWETPFGLVNNAALDSPPDAPAAENGPFESYPESSFDKVMDINVKGTMLACQVFGGAMARLGRGSIINVASIYGMVSPDQGLYEYRRQQGETFFKPVAYSISKSAIYNLTRYLAVYWGLKAVRVNTVTFSGVFNHQHDDFLKKYLPKVPLGRMADEADYNGAVVFLVSDAARYMTGSNMVIDGGFTAM